MLRTRIIVAALAALALAAPAASADPHAIDAHHRALLEKQDLRSADAIDSAIQAELKARGRDGVQTGSLAGTTDATTRALEIEKTYSTYGEPVSSPKQTPVPPADGDGLPLAPVAGLIGVALLFVAAVALIARPRRPRTA